MDWFAFVFFLLGAFFGALGLTMLFLWLIERALRKLR